ncbi:hypothetical protein P171DRAFT_228374 [Karstenula rhodostoma CBS 690.94]|uniref:Uncharacterized protein n=1 Tax=Karstenula rhodostoma CBS 690.94 TaxID=1392251 RepID=A0A9P4PM21_9PLEO|nr:hypothetical protein P171DRAFT_228374 [Karstenula rhodostoma CBS 690.94]
MWVEGHGQLRKRRGSPQMHPAHTQKVTRESASPSLAVSRHHSPHVRTHLIFEHRISINQHGRFSLDVPSHHGAEGYSASAVATDEPSSGVSYRPRVVPGQLPMPSNNMEVLNSPDPRLHTVVHTHGVVWSYSCPLDRLASCIHRSGASKVAWPETFCTGFMASHVPPPSIVSRPHTISALSLNHGAMGLPCNSNHTSGSFVDVLPLQLRNRKSNSGPRREPPVPAAYAGSSAVADPDPGQEVTRFLAAAYSAPPRYRRGKRSFV